jgi:hypothetical protein
MMSKNMVYKLSTAWAKQLDDPLEWEKEVIYESDYFETPDTAFSVDEDLIMHWHDTVTKMLSEGVGIPVPLRHTENTEDNRGQVFRSRVGVNSKGKQALFLGIRFRDADAAKLAKSSDVSIFVPGSFKDGKGRTWFKPIRHVALTNYPVIPGLEPFKPIVASLVEKKIMSLSSLAEKLSIPVADKEEAELEAAIVSAFSDLTRQVEDLTKKVTELEGGEVDPEDEEEEEAPVAASLVNLMRDNRTMKIDALVGEGRITPAVAAAAKKKFTGDVSLKLSLAGKADDGFDGWHELAKANEPVISLKGKTGAQALRLSHGNDSGDSATNNGLIRDAERRAAEAAKRR